MIIYDVGSEYYIDDWTTDGHIGWSSESFCTTRENAEILKALDPYLEIRPREADMYRGKPISELTKEKKKYDVSFVVNVSMDEHELEMFLTSHGITETERHGYTVYTGNKNFVCTVRETPEKP